MKRNYTTLCISLNAEHKGVFIGEIGHQRVSTEPRVEPRRAVPQDCCENVAIAAFCGKAWEARIAPPAVRFPNVPLSAVLAGFQIWAHGFDETTLQSQ